MQVYLAVLLPPAHPLAPEGDRRTGLLPNGCQSVDDEVSELLIDTIVKMIGKEILKVETGVEAVEVCRENPDIDLVLMDIQLPELNGYEATRQIRKFNKGVVIIAQTAYGFSGDREEATEAGCNDYMAKPIIKDELLSLIQKYFKT